MGKSANARRKAARVPTEALDGPTPAQIANGSYTRDDIIHADDARRATVHINRGGTPLARWKALGALSDSQIAAIDHCIGLWERAGIHQQVTANYGERIPGNGDCEKRFAAMLDARDDLWRIIDYFPGPLRTYYNVFELVCRWDTPAGTAGSALSPSTRTNDARAHQVVCFVADIIAMKERL